MNRSAGRRLFSREMSATGFTRMASDLVKAVVSWSFLTNVHSVDYAVPDGPSRITRGLRAA